MFPGVVIVPAENPAKEIMGFENGKFATVDRSIDVCWLGAVKAQVRTRKPINLNRGRGTVRSTFWINFTLHPRSNSRSAEVAFVLRRSQGSHHLQRVIGRGRDEVGEDFNTARVG